MDTFDAQYETLTSELSKQVKKEKKLSEYLEELVSKQESLLQQNNYLKS